MDRTLLNLASLLIGGAGLVTVLTGYNVPEVSGSFYGSNPFLFKRNAIEEVSGWIFSSVAAIGLLLQVVAEIIGDQLPTRIHSAQTYGIAAGVGLLGVAVMLWGLAVASRKIAERKWVPRVAEEQGELLERAAFIIAHDGFQPEEYPHLNEYSELHKAEKKAQNLKQAEVYLSQVERLFEARPSGDLTARVEIVRRRLGGTAVTKR